MAEEFVVSARLIADASGFRSGTAEAKAGLDSLKGAGQQAAQGARQVEGATAAAAAGTRNFGAAARQAAAELRQAYGGATPFAAAIAGVQQATHPATGSQRALAEALRLSKTAFETGAMSANAYGRVLAVAGRSAREAARSGTGNVVSLGQQRAGYMMLGQQIQDVGMQVALGTNLFQVMAMQAGQTALAVQQMGAGGAAGRVAAFLGGPFGSAILAGVSILGMFAVQALSSADALDENESAQRRSITAADALGQAQSALGQMFDLATGRIQANTEALRANIAYQAHALRMQGIRQAAQGRLFAMGAGQQVAAFDIFNNPAAGAVAQRYDREAFLQFQNIRNIAVNAGLVPGRRTGPAIDRAEAVRLFGQADTSALRRYGIPFSGLQLAEQANNLVQGEATVDIANAALESERTGRLDPRFRRPGGGGGRRRRRGGDGGASRLAEFGADSGTRIRELAAQFQDTPPQVDRVSRALADLDDLLEDIEERRPPNFQQLLKQGREARTVIEEGINRPYLDYLDQQNESLAVQRLIAQGRDDEAQALQAIQQIEARMGPLGEERRDAILAGVQALRAEERQLEINRAKMQPFLDAIKDTRAQLTETIQAGLSGDIATLRDIPGRIFGSFLRMQAESIAESIFGDAFRELQDQVTGTNIVEDAAQRFRDAADQSSRSVDTMGEAAGQAARALERLAGAAPAAAAGPEGDTAQPDLIVTGQRVKGPDPAGPAAKTENEAMYERIARRLAQAVGINEDNARLIARAVGAGLQGAMYGSMASGGLAMLGIGHSRSGAQIGGTFGNVAGGLLKGTITDLFGKSAGALAGPFGAAAGALIGAFAGKLLSGGAKTGSATIGTVGGRLGVAGTRGSSSGFRTASGTAATSVIDALDEIAAQFGGSLTGTPSVSIGIRNGKYRVDPTGQGRTKTKKGAIDFGEDQGAAIAFATLDAIRDGVIAGMSAAVQKALGSSDDLQKAVREALKVQELEDLLSDLGSSAAREFREFERMAKERVRVAREYGFDLVKIEELNAKQRSALLDQVLASRIGALKELLEDLNYGDLFEGSLADRRTKLLGEVGKAEADAAAGVDGAADRLAQLSRQLVELSREAYGTAGPEFAADRGRAISSAERVIALENERVRLAQEQARQTNQHLDEVNDQLAIGNSLNRQMLGVLETIAANTGGGGSIALADTSRLVRLKAATSL